MICEQWDVIVVPFPFAESMDSKRRPALVLSRGTFNSAGHSVMAMITSAAHQAWPGDCEVTDRTAAGLRLRCIVRLKLFTLDNRLAISRLGALGHEDRAAVTAALRTFLF